MAGKYSPHHPKMVNRPGTNWVEKAGNLPPVVDSVARALVAKGWSQQRAIATAINHVKKVCATGMAFGGKTKVSAEAQAKACAAVAQWEALKARAHAMATDPDERRAVELAFKRIEGEAIFSRPLPDGMTLELALDTTVELAAHKPGLVPATITVRSKNGKTFQRKIMVRPSQAKGLKAKPQVQSEQGAKVTPAVSKVFQALAAVPKEQRPKGWEKAVKVLADSRHGGRLGPEKRRLLHSLAQASPKGSPVRLAAAAALKADAGPKAKPKKGKRVKPTRKARRIAPMKS